MGLTEALKRATSLMHRLGGGVVHAGIIDEYPKKVEFQTLPLRVGRCNDYIGIDLSAEEMAGLLNSIRIEAEVVDGDTIQAQVPPWRVGSGAGGGFDRGDRQALWLRRHPGDSAAHDRFGQAPAAPERFGGADQAPYDLRRIEPRSSPTPLSRTRLRPCWACPRAIPGFTRFRCSTPSPKTRT